MDADPRELLEQGFVILRGVVPGGGLPRMRDSCERLLERQKKIWKRERRQGDPPGGEWELAKQRFETLDARLQAGCDQFEPMMHVTSTRYRFYDMPEDFEVDDFIAGWG